MNTSKAATADDGDGGQRYGTVRAI